MAKNSRRTIYAVFVGLLLLLVGVGLVNSEEIRWGGLIMVCIFYILIFWIGIWSSKKSMDGAGDSFMLAGRRLPLWIAMLTMAATWLGGGYINGTAEAAYSSGLVWVQAPWGYGLSLIIGGIFFARKMRRFRFRTMLDPLTQRFGHRSTGLFFIPALLGELFWIAAILTALGTTFSVIIGLDTSSSIIISAAIAILYTTIGGLWSVAYTDILQLALLVLGLLLIIPFLFTDGMNVTQLNNAYNRVFETASSLVPKRAEMGNYFWNWCDIGLLLIFGGIPWQVYFQRVLAARNEKTAMWLSIFAGVICIMMAVPSALIGMVGAVTDWSALGLVGPANAASILPYVVYQLTPSWVSALALAAIVAAVMSSIDSSMLSASTMAAWNVYRPLIRPNLDSFALKKIVQKLILIVGTAATLLSLQVSSVYALWYLCSDLIYCLLFPALVLALFDPKANRVGAVSGFVVAAILRLGGGDPTLGLPILIPYPMIEDGMVLFPFRTFSMITGLLTMMVVSRVFQKRYPATPLLMIEKNM